MELHFDEASIWSKCATDLINLEGGGLRGGFRGSSLGSLDPPFLKLARYQQALTEFEDPHSSGS